MADRCDVSFARTIDALAFGDDGRRLYTVGRDGPDKVRATSSPGMILFLFENFLVNRIH